MSPRPEGPPTCSYKTCPASMSRLRRGSSSWRNFEVCVALDTETPARQRGSLCPVVQDSLWFIPLSPATWWSTLELQGPEWEPETCPYIRPLPPPGSPPTLRINPSPDLMCCPIRALATARPVAHPHTHSRTPALRTGAVSALASAWVC